MAPRGERRDRLVDVVEGLDEAFADNISGRVIDVPLLIGTTGQEIEMCPPHDWRGVSSELFADDMNRTFAQWGEGVARGLLQQYEPEIAESRQLAFASSSDVFRRARHVEA